MNKLYRPSNGSEGQAFMDQFCDKCIYYDNCDILNESLLEGQVKEWVVDADNKAKCLMFSEAGWIDCSKCIHFEFGEPLPYCKKNLTTLTKLSETCKHLNIKVRRIN